MVTREPEFDDAELQRLLAYMAYRRGICDCGLHQSLTGDRSNYFTFDSATCSVCKGLAQYQRVLAAEDQRLIDAMGDNPAPAAPRPGDGRRLFVRQLSADEVEKRRPQSERAAVAAAAK